MSNVTAMKIIETEPSRAAVSRIPSPVVISFYCGAQYYYDAAEQLREDCAKWGLESDIVEIEKRPEENWIDICRRKIPFYLEMLRKHQRPVMWIDVDSRIVKFPHLLDGATCDIAGFLRQLKYISGFDPYASARFFMPCVLYFNYTPRTIAFLEFMAKLERESQVAATDDFFLQEAWEKFDQQLSVMLIPPELSGSRLASPEQVFVYGSSGNVSEFRGKAQQHVAAIQTPARRKAILLHEAVEAGKAKKTKDALFFYRKALDLDRTDDALAHKIARMLRREGKLKQALVFLRRHQGTPFTVNHARRFLADTEMEAGKIERAGAIIRQLAENGTPLDKAWAQSRLMRIELEERAAQLGLSPAERPALWWMEGPYPGNFGDILNPYIVEKLSGLPPRFVPRGQGMLAIGSIIKFATEKTAVWGSGTPRMTDKLDPKASYRAVRGPLSRQLVLESGGQCPEVYGDAAWFLPSIYTPKSTVKRYKLGLIRHYVNDPEISGADDVKVISVMRAGYAGIEQFIDEINECEQIVTTSLHGLIVSHAYGIPALWAEVTDSSNPLPGDGTKFHDYMMSVGLDPVPAHPLTRGQVVTTELLRETFRLPRKQIDLEALAAAAPFKVVANLKR